MDKRTDKLDFINVKNFCSAKTLSREFLKSHWLGKIFAEDISDKRLLWKIYKKLFKFNNKKTNKPIKKWDKGLNRHYTKEDIQMQIRILKYAPHTLAIIEKQI